ncbi:50S ribosomal protein L2 [Picrophilus oshimae]|uniref:Large ribosomal subunit protein uL2 n=2 Tax=Picrophilus torridus (strain ATCC 700027 / DSM 9790 / JCM 10055 / NBRC 100828 / KAW 2/3) TaxID=1122961 RepID=RL2_PICTO|nr:50S ribosomal protein L2 [Picrophilus oshimae]Q6L1C4.1 RecName: Full=Large ribosomal subunit protein uL2; AltName: Full=50S ribosomal protein L2 [Picrophilus oshimae DSM 9789]AAT43228.1 large subunit ribosomal protein L2P [Picrophilus oshimae DSM 9789]SMD30467.1 LSU ribosomal protein L2P [Picrophilus oshimae DSM 9789]
MGKHIVAQRRGHGSLVYRSPSHRHLGDIKYPRDGTYKIEDIIQAPGRNTPVLLIRNEKNEKNYMIAFNGAYVNQEIHVGDIDSPAIGDVTYLANIPDGSYVYNIESIPGDGGKFCRAAGTAALVISHGAYVSLKLPSGVNKEFHPRCRATVGFIAGSGARDIPILKAGTHIKYLQSKAKRPYTVRGVAMNAVNHPHGGGNHQHVGRPSTVGRGTPPGRKVGRLSPKRRKKYGR